MSKTIAIHQPNFMPWYPYFQKMQECDLFVIMAHCQFEKGGYQNRFYLDGKWHTMSVDGEYKNKYGIPKTIVEKTYPNAGEDWDKIKKDLSRYNFNGFNFWPTRDILRTNMFIIEMARLFLKINTPLKSDYPTNYTGSERLLDICLKNGATKYLSGISGKKYLDIDLFERNGIEVIFQDESKMDRRHILEVL